MNHLFIVTGASRGLGRALALQWLRPGHHVIGIARRPDASLQAPAGAQLTQWTQDLAEPVAAAAQLEAFLASVAPDACRSATLVNNAALLAPPGPITEPASADLSAALRVGLEAPVMLTAAFLRATRGWQGQRRVLQISSGLGRRAMAGSAAYCAVKGGLDHFTRALALDEALQPNGARVVSLAPGVIDTDMQVQLRGADASYFPDRSRFEQLKQDNALTSPEAAAARIAALVERADFGREPIADVRDA